MGELFVSIAKRVLSWLCSKGPLGILLAVLFLLLCAGGFVWWSWPEVVRRPGADQILQALNRGALPKSDANRLNILVARLNDDDPNDNGAKLLSDKLSKFEGLHVFRIKYLILESERGEQNRCDEKGQREARELLSGSGARVLIWGSVGTYTNPPTMRLCWTFSQGEAGSDHPFDMPEADLAMPSLNWTNLTKVIGLIVRSSLAAFFPQNGAYQVAQLLPFVDDVRALLNENDETWTAVDRASVSFALAYALEAVGAQKRDAKALSEALGIDQELLKQNVWRPKRDQLRWAVLQNDLGVEYADLGVLTRDHSATLFKNAFDSFQNALMKYPPDGNPGILADIQSNSSAALAAYVAGQHRTSGVDVRDIRESVHELNDLLKKPAAGSASARWSRTQLNLGTVLKVPGEEELKSADSASQGIHDLKTAVAADGEALKVFSSTVSPIYWAYAMENLAVALEEIGEREAGEAGTNALKEAVEVDGALLQSRTAKWTATDWGPVENNLGFALVQLGERESSTSRFAEAVQAHRAALDSYRLPGNVDAWAASQNNLGIAMEKMGSRESNGRSDIEGAIHAFAEAMDKRSKKRDPIFWAEAEDGLGVAYEKLGELDLQEQMPGKAREHFGEAANAHGGALKVYRSHPQGVPAGARERADANLLNAREHLAELKPGVAELGQTAKNGNRILGRRSWAE